MLQLRFNGAADIRSSVPTAADEGRIIAVESTDLASGYNIYVCLGGTWLLLPVQSDPGEISIPVTQSDTAHVVGDLAVNEIRFRVSSTDILYTDWNDAGVVKSGPTDGTAMT